VVRERVQHHTARPSSANAKNSAVSSVSVSNPINGTKSAHHVLRWRSIRSSPVTPVANPHDRMVSTTSAHPVNPAWPNEAAQVR
jgi:hypothetical protein